MKLRTLCALLWSAALPLAVSPTASAGVNRWTSVGPPGAAIQSLAIDPGNSARIYATKQPRVLGVEAAGIYRTVDGGVTWDLHEFPNSLFMGGVVVDPGNSSIVYTVGYPVGGLFRSEDGGATWTKSLDQSGRALTSITRDPVQPGTIYMIAKDFLFVSRGESICKTIDGGRSLRFCFQFPNGAFVSSITIDPSAHDRVLALSTGGVWTSTDGGRTFAPPTSASFPSDGRGGVSRTRDGGVFWERTPMASMGRHRSLSHSIPSTRARCMRRRSRDCSA